MHRVKIVVEDYMVEDDADWDPNINVNDYTIQKTETIIFTNVSQINDFLNKCFHSNANLISQEGYTLSYYDIDMECIWNHKYIHVIVKTITEPYKLFSISIPFMTTYKYHCTHITATK